MNEHELKPCPFCGEQVELQLPNTGSLGYSQFLISCCVEMQDTDYDNIIDKWNTRTKPLRAWYSTTKEGATEKHPFKDVTKMDKYELVWARYGDIDVSIPVYVHQSKGATYICDRYEDSPPTFEN